ncbi:MAG: VacJ family lipoprotein [Halocynthiibacter sp.]
MKTQPRVISVIMVVSLLMLTTGCAITSARSGSDSTGTGQVVYRDPLERTNRAILNFNFKVDRFVLRPVARVYAKLPRPVRNGVGNFFANMWIPNTILNDLLQGKFAEAGRDTGRFVINTILGFFGLMDVATGLDLPARKEDFGQTLAVWGVPAGPYLVLPFLGPSNLRDTFGLVPQYAYTDVLFSDLFFTLDPSEAWATAGLRLVDTRARLLGADRLLELQPDRYLFLREGYRQLRNRMIYDGNPPIGQDDISDDELLDELLEQE